MADGRSSIKQGQIDILEILYKYRFGSRALLAESLQVSPITLHKKLAVLIKHGLIGSKQEKRLKLYGIPMAYFLTPKGLRFLQQLPDHEYITDAVIKNSYRDKSASQKFINHTLSVYTHTNTLKAQYPPLKIFLRRDMSRYSYFPESPPDAFLSLKVDVHEQPKRFFLDVIPEHMEQKVLYNKIGAYLEFFERGKWEVTKSETPSLLLVCHNGTAERRIRKTVIAAINRGDFDELEVYTTTVKALVNDNATSEIWTGLDDVDETVTLTKS